MTGGATVCRSGIVDPSGLHCYKLAKLASASEGFLK